MNDFDMNDLVLRILQEAVDKGMKAERKACIKIAEGMTCVYPGPSLRVEGFDLAKASIAAAIRERGEV